VAAHSASITGSRARARAVSRAMRCRASAPRSKVIRPWRVIWAAVWLAAEWVTPTAPARSRMDSGPSTTSARITGLYRGR
jgi:hypothetical protein